MDDLKKKLSPFATNNEVITIGLESIGIGKRVKKISKDDMLKAINKIKGHLEPTPISIFFQYFKSKTKLIIISIPISIFLILSMVSTEEVMTPSKKCTASMVSEKECTEEDMKRWYTSLKQCTASMVSEKECTEEDMKRWYEYLKTKHQ